MTTLSLSAWIGKQRVGTLRFHDDTGRFSFSYEQSWIEHVDGYPISPALPFQRPPQQSDEFHSVNVRRFFENLLPEGQALEDAAASHRVAKGNLFGLLRWLGQESTGALALLPDGETPEKINNVMRKIRRQELSERIRDRANRPFNVWDGRVRMSIAGYQDKLSVYVDNEGTFNLVEGEFASTHILKPEPRNPKLSQLVANEHFCLKLSAALGVPSASASILRVPEPVLLVQRFDRIAHKTGVERLHVVDSCQVLNLSVNHKYERNFGCGRDVAHIRDGVSLEKLFSIAALTQSEAATRMTLIRWTILQYLIGNSDAHGKNVSFLVEPGGLRIAPAYDLVSVCIYPDIEHEFAMAIGDEFNISKVRAYDWAEFAACCNIERRLLVREMNRMIKTLRTQIQNLAELPEYETEEKALLHKMSRLILKQATQLENDAKMIEKVVLE
ncbi:MAG: HipA domain-containing protein [Gammaproteobacteria bacterium]|nr:HipA domain-containing protein [Gammaproteobacteria bacterium]MDH5694609.1 HipA domain-containing protein [Gammaproteobacteria bacterium]